jgi:hypothetical protein
VLESEGGLTIVALANLDPPAAEEAAQKLRDLFGRH